MTRSDAFLLRCIVSVVVMTLWVVVMGFPLAPFWIALLFVAVVQAACVGAEALVERTWKPAHLRAGKPTPADRRWELKMLLRRAFTAERDERWEKAIALFEQVIEQADEQEDLDLAVRHIDDIRKKQLVSQAP